MGGDLRVFVHADDPVLEQGVAALVATDPGMTATGDLDTADVAVVVSDRVDDATVRTLGAIGGHGAVPLVVVAGVLDADAVLLAAQAGAFAFVRRRDATVGRLAAAVRAAAADEGHVPPDLVGVLLHEMSGRPVAPVGPATCGFSERELAILRLVAEGYDTLEIARRLYYSERTVKGVLHEVTTRFQLRNRTQAVAFAVRQGVI